jgi:heme/copper-type cytochrome/quinol oxidase subunit 3
MTIALPAAHAPAPKRQMLVATTAASTVAAMLMAGMLAVWLRFRAAAPVRESSDGLKLIKDWLPANLHIPEVATNTMFATFFVGCVMAQWAVYATKRRDTAHVNLALAICFIIGAAIINAQIAVYLQFDVGIADGAYQVMRSPWCSPRLRCFVRLVDVPQAQMSSHRTRCIGMRSL